jgi:hypothetical protein
VAIVAGPSANAAVTAAHEWVVVQPAPEGVLGIPQACTGVSPQPSTSRPASIDD